MGTLRTQSTLLSLIHLLFVNGLPIPVKGIGSRFFAHIPVGSALSPSRIRIFCNTKYSLTIQNKKYFSKMIL